MRRLSASLAALIALVSPVAVNAQDAHEADVRESLQCAIWASYFSVAFDGREEGVAFAHALNYFVGRYEGLTGEGIDQALDEALIVESAGNLDALTPICADRMEAYGTRMSDWGKALQAIGERMPSEDLGPTS